MITEAGTTLRIATLKAPLISYSETVSPSTRIAICMPTPIAMEPWLLKTDRACLRKLASPLSIARSLDQAPFTWEGLGARSLGWSLHTHTWTRSSLLEDGLTGEIKTGKCMFALSSLPHAFDYVPASYLTNWNHIFICFAGPCFMDNTSVGDQGLNSEDEFLGLGSSLPRRLNHLFHLVLLMARNGSQTFHNFKVINYTW